MYTSILSYSSDLKRVYPLCMKPSQQIKYNAVKTKVILQKNARCNVRQLARTKNLLLTHILLLKNINIKLNKITNHDEGLYVIFSDNKGPVMEIPVPKDKTVTSYYTRHTK